MRGPNACLLHKSNKQLQTEEIAQRKLWTITKNKQKNLRSSETEDGPIENYRKHFICVTPSPSTELLGAKGNSLRGILPHREKENRRTPSRLTTYRHLQSLLLRTLIVFTKLMPADGAAESPLMHQLPKLELLLQHRRICSQGPSTSSLGSRCCDSLPQHKSQVTDLFYHYCAATAALSPAPRS